MHCACLFFQWKPKQRYQSTQWFVFRSGIPLSWHCKRRFLKAERERERENKQGGPTIWGPTAISRERRKEIEKVHICCTSAMHPLKWRIRPQLLDDVDLQRGEGRRLVLPRVQVSLQQRLRQFQSLSLPLWRVWSRQGREFGFLLEPRLSPSHVFPPAHRPKGRAEQR